MTVERALRELGDAAEGDLFCFLGLGLGRVIGFRVQALGFGVGLGSQGGHSVSTTSAPFNLKGSAFPNEECRTLNFDLEQPRLHRPLSDTFPHLRGGFWVAVKELILTHYVGETLLCTTYTPIMVT